MKKNLVYRILPIVFVSVITFFITKLTIKPIQITKVQNKYLNSMPTLYKADVNGDKIQDSIEFNDIECDLGIDNNKCNNTDEYVQVTVRDGKTYNQLAESEKLHHLNSSNPEIMYKNLNGINFFFIGGLDRGAHSSHMIVLSQEGSRLVLKCHKSSQKDLVDGCNYWSDAGGPYLQDLDGDGVPEIIEEGRTYSDNNFNEIKLRNVTEFKNNSFIMADSRERYEYFLNFYRTSIRENLKVVSKYDNL